MASKNERARWERWYESVTDRMNRQKKSLDRVVLLLTEAVSALEEVAERDPGDDWLLEDARDRARSALEKIKSPAAAGAVGEAESITTEEPVEDPRRK